MSQAIVKASSTTWINQPLPGNGYPSAGALQVTEATNQAARGFIFTTVPVPHTATVSSATLTVYLVGPQPGWGGLSIYRCTNRIADSAKTWKNQPSIGSQQGATVTPAGTVADATPVTFDVTSLVQQWANGGLPNFGIEIKNSGTNRRQIYSAHSAHPPTLTINYTTPPDTPHNLMPNGVIGTATPVLAFGPYGDADGDALQAIRVQIAPTSTGFTAPTFDSGWVNTTAPELDLSQVTVTAATLSAALSTSGAITSLPVTATSEPIASGATVTVTSGAHTQTWTLTAAAATGATTLSVASQTPNFAYPSGSTVTAPFAGFTSTAQYWRVQVQDSSGQNSAWSDPASCTVAAKPTVTFSSPSAATPQVHEATPQIVWTAPGMTSWRARILDATSLAVLADSGHQFNNIGQWGVPANVIQPSGNYIAELFVWDVSRSPSPGDNGYTYATQAFTFVPGATATPTAVTVTQGGDWPGEVIVGCNAASAPDYFTVYMDGKVLASQLAPGMYIVSGTTYAFPLHNVPPGKHTFQVDAVTAGVASAASAVVQFTNVINGIWLGDPVRKIWAMISSGTDTSVDNLKMTDQATEVPTIDGTNSQVVVRGMNGLGTNGSPITGHLSPKAYAGVPSVETRAANLMLLKSQPRTTLRLIIGPYNIPVRVWNLHVGPSTNHSSQASWRNVSFEFRQYGELPFSATF